MMKETGTSLCEVVALMAACRRLIVVSVGPPLVVVAIPWFLEIYVWLMNGITAGHGILCSMLTLVLTYLGIDAIRRYAPTPKQCDDAFEQSKIILPILSFVLARTLTFIIAEWRALDTILMFTPSFHAAVTFRVSACMLLLNVAVVLRFVGSVSVVRCSSVPLRSHPMTSSIVSFLTAFTSIHAFVDLIAKPSDAHGTLLESSFAAEQYGGLRRYQRASNAAYVAQYLVSIAIGTLVAIVAPLRAAEDEASILTLFRFASCISAVVISLSLTSLDGVSHELDPKEYMVGFWGAGKSELPFPEQKTLVVSSSMIVALSVASTYLARDNSVPLTSSMCDIASALVHLAAPFFIFVYLFFVEEAARRMLCVPNVSLKSLLMALSEDTSLETRLEVALYSLLYGDESLLRSVSTRTEKPGMAYVEVEEVNKSEQCKDHMARILLGMDWHHLVRRSQLELDMLRVYLLQSIGGNDAVIASKAVGEWINPHPTMSVSSAALESAAVPLLRALCSYAGGLGKALSLCSLPTNHPRRLEFEDSSTAFSTWYLPPGARACGEWAVLGAARLLVSSLTSSKVAVADWKASSLAILIPTVLQTFHTLREGVLNYILAGKTEVSSADGDIDFDLLVADKKKLRPLFVACDTAALMIIDSIHSHEGSRTLKVPVHPDCRQWLDGLTSR